MEVSFDDGVRSIEVVAFYPAQASGREKCPAVILLHGIEGATRYGDVHAQTARWLADQGYAVFCVHYFDSVDYPDLWHWNEDGTLDNATVDRLCWQDADRWTRAVDGCIAELSRRTDIDPNSIALYGLSLGGFISLSTAQQAVHESRPYAIRAVVVNWGAQFETTEISPGFPPTLHIHGQLDEIVPLAWAEQSVEEIRSQNVQAELFIVPDAGHVARSKESDRAATVFLSRHLDRNDALSAQPWMMDQASANGLLQSEMVRLIP
jgi:dienelactone hydrolase